MDGRAVCLEGPHVAAAHLARVVDAADVLVLDSRLRARLRQQPLGHGGIAAADQLQRHRAAQDGVLGAVDVGHAPRAQEAEAAVAPELLADLQLLGDARLETAGAGRGRVAGKGIGGHGARTDARL